MPQSTLAATWTIGPIELIAVLLLAGALLALVAALREGGWSAMIGRQSPSDKRVRADDEPDAARAADELRALITEARTLSDELAERFDQRSAELRRLLADAESLVERGAAPPPSPPSFGEREVKFVHPAPSHQSASTIEPRPPSVAEAEAMAAAHARPHPFRGPHNEFEEPDAIAREIYRLSDAGLPPVEIAGRLGQHTGKVELILALRRA